MASLDKTSVRSQVEKVRKDFEQLRSDGKVSPEVQAIMSSMLMIVELILAIFWSEPPRRIALTPAFLLANRQGQFVAHRSGQQGQR
ncbi:hypothetical protein [Ferrovum myxofaciens]|uniref:hypothetical protein n=1 Tax=Ferrovum myxofaciens TaxID=416213 RepID=UPI003EB6BD85